MSKARKAGWTGYEDTWESFERVLREPEAAQIITIASTHCIARFCAETCPSTIGGHDLQTRRAM